MDNDLTVNTSGSDFMHVLRRKAANQPEIYYNDIFPTRVDSFRYLGVNISRTNNLSKVLDETCQKTRKAQRVIDMYIVNHPTVSLDHI